MGSLADLLHQFRWPLQALTPNLIRDSAWRGSSKNHTCSWDSAEDVPHTTPESYYCACYNSKKKESAPYQ